MWQDPPEEDNTGSLMRALQKILAGEPLRDAPPPVRSQVPPPIVPGQVGPLRPVPSQNPWARDVEKFDTRVAGLVDPGFSAPSSATPAISPAPAGFRQPKAKPRGVQAALSGRPREVAPSRDRIEATTSRPRIIEGADPYRPAPDSLPVDASGDDDVKKVLGSLPASSIPSLEQQGADLSLPSSRDRVARGGWKGTLMSALKGAFAGAAQGMQSSEGNLAGALGGAITGATGSAISPERGRSYYWEQIEQPRLDRQAAQEQARQAGSLELALKRSQAETAGYGPRKAQTDIALGQARIADMESRRGWDVEDRQYQREDREALRQQRIAAAKRSEWFIGPGYAINYVTRERIDLPHKSDGTAMTQVEAEAYLNDVEGRVDEIAADSRSHWEDGWRQFATPETQKVIDDPKAVELYGPEAVAAAHKARLAAEQRYVRESEKFTGRKRKQDVQALRTGRAGAAGKAASGAVRSAGTLRWD